MKATFTIAITGISLDAAYKRALAAAKLATGSGQELVVSRSSVRISPEQRMQDGRILTFEYDFTLELAVDRSM